MLQSIFSRSKDGVRAHFIATIQENEALDAIRDNPTGLFYESK